MTFNQRTGMYVREPEVKEQGLRISTDEITLPGGIPSVYEYVKQGSGVGVVVIPMTIGRQRALIRQNRHPLSTSLWEFPRRITPVASVTEAEACLFEATGLNSTCRMIGRVAPESGVLSTEYAIFEAFIQDDPGADALPRFTSPVNTEARWFSEEQLAHHLTNSVLTDALTLSSIVLQTMEENASGF